MALRRLIVMRHAKSSWKSAALRDLDRPLSKRGRKDAPRIGRELQAIGWVPERAVVSPSERTQETFRLMASALDATKAVTAPKLYHASADTILGLIATIPDAITTALTLGHNPGTEEVLRRLTGDLIAMKTGCAALLTTEADTWKEAIQAPSAFRLIGVLYPRLLAEKS